MADAPDIEALVAEARQAGSAWTLAGPTALLTRLADALERQQAVVKAARAWERGYYFEDRMQKALAALDAKPEGDG